MTVAQVTAPSGADVAAILGRSSDDAWISSVGNVVASLACNAAESYCRGVGFSTSTDDEGTVTTKVPQSVSWAILLRAVRLAGNYSQLVSESRDNVTLVYGQAAAQGFTLPELQALDAYRLTAA